MKISLQIFLPHVFDKISRDFIENNLFFILYINFKGFLLKLHKMYKIHKKAYDLGAGLKIILSKKSFYVTTSGFKFPWGDFLISFSYEIYTFHYVYAMRSKMVYFQ